MDAGEKVLSLPPYEAIDFNPENLTGAKFSRIFIYVRAKDGELEMVHTSKLFFQEETTNYFFLYPQGRRRVRIMRVAGHGEEAADDATLFQPPATGTPAPRR